MAKPKGSSSFVSLTIDEIKTALGGRTDIPVKVSKGWLASAKEVFGTSGADAAEAPEPGDEDEGKQSGGVKIEE